MRKQCFTAIVGMSTAECSTPAGNLGLGKMVAAVFGLLATTAFGAASSGLRWTAPTAYEDGSAIEPGAQLVYLVYDATGKQVASSRTVSIAASALPADGCYTLKSALYDAVTNNVVPNSQSTKLTEPYCIKPPQKRVPAPSGVGSL